MLLDSLAFSLTVQVGLIAKELWSNIKKSSVTSGFYISFGRRLSSVIMFIKPIHLQYVCIMFLLQVPFNAPKGLLKFRNIHLKSKAYKLRSGQCCSSGCKSLCKLWFRICLPGYKSTDGQCIITGISENVVTSQTRELDVTLDSTYGHPMAFTLSGVQQNSSISNGEVFEVVDNKKIAFLNSSWIYLSYVTKTIQLNLEYKLSCFPHHYDVRCNRQCNARDDFIGHYECDVYGRYICLPGWVGQYCNTKGCNPACKHGKCDSTTCKCDQGWSGKFCEKDLHQCFTEPCLNGGTCKSNGKCECENGYTGNQCQLQVTTTYNLIPSTTYKQQKITPTRSSKVTMATLSMIPWSSSTTSGSSTNTATYLSLSSSMRHFSSSNSVTLFSSSFLFISSSSSVTSSLSTSASNSTTESTQHTITPLSSRLTQHVDETSSATISSSRHFDISKLIDSTSWIALSTAAASSITMVTNKPNISTVTSRPNPSQPIIAPIIISLSLMAILFSLIGVGIMWKRLKYRNRRRSKTIPSSDGPSIRSVPSTSSLSTGTSISPILRGFYDTHRTVDEPREIDTISVISYPVTQPVDKSQSYDVKKYTMRAVDKICWQVINGTDSRRKNKTKKVKQSLSSNRRKSQNSAEYSSSGYCSSTASPKPSSSSQHSFISECFSPEDVYNVSATHSDMNNNNRGSGNIPRDSVISLDTCGSKNDICDEDSPVTRENSSSELSHNRKVFKYEKFEGLPNFISYKEEEL